MSHKEHIEIDYLARAEGETALRVEIDREPAIELKIFEPPRFFEGFLVGRKFDEVGDIVSRICGICPVSHMMTAILAVEKAMNIKVSGQTRTLRDLMTASQVVASHLIHLYMLAMPDYYGKSGVTEMLPDFEKEIKRLMKMKEIMNGLTGLIGGRAEHPVTALPGGFTDAPKTEDLAAIAKQLKDIVSCAKEVVKDISRLKVPEFNCPSEYVALGQGGSVLSTAGLDIPVDEYPNYFQESEIGHGFAKQSRIKDRGSFMVGALARFNLNFDALQNETKSLAKEIGFVSPVRNPFLNNLAQSLEVFDGILRCIRLIEGNQFDEEFYKVQISAGEGGAITEAPRGMLYHYYAINEKGVVKKANIVTPTAHNFLNIEETLKKLIQENPGKPRDELRLLSEKLVRAYDPCFSCSVH